MAALPHLVMKHWDPMIGVDIHIPTIPAPPGKGPPAPFATFDFLSGLYIGFTPIQKHLSLYGVVVAKGTDIGPMIPHAGPPHLTLALDMALSSSKSHFGSIKYKAENKNPALAAALFVNPNLNCGTPVPTPTGLVTCFNTHGASMSLGDILAGAFALLADAAIQAAFNALGSYAGGKLGGKMAQGLGALGAPKSIAATKLMIKWVGPAVFGFAFGGPMGMDAGTFGLGVLRDSDGNSVTPGGYLASQANTAAEMGGQALGDYLSGEPSGMPPPEFSAPGVGAPKPKIPNVTDNPPM